MSPRFSHAALFREDTRQVGLRFAVLRVELNRALIMVQSLIRVSEVLPSQTEIEFGFRDSRLSLQCGFVFWDGLVHATRGVKSLAIIELSLRIPGQHLGDLLSALERGHKASPQLSGTQRAEWNY